MDLGAYGQIERLSKTAAENGINVPRLRGYRLMSEENPIPIEEAMKGVMDSFFYESFADEVPAFAINTWCAELSSRTRKLRKKYLTKDHMDLRWDRIHGRKRKNAKYLIKKQQQRVIEQYTVFNRYAGKQGVLYIHARIGGCNWLTYGGNKLMTEPWFLEKVDDAIDETYCDIYARIGGAYGFKDVAEWRMDEE